MMSKYRKQDLRFGQTAITLGLLDKAQLRICLRLQKEACERGDDRPLSSWVLQKRYLDTTQIGTIQHHCRQKKVPATSLPKTRSKTQPAPPVKTRVLPGISLGRYKLIEEIGRGGMGHVYKAYDQRLQRHVALKLLTAGETQIDIERFLREARATANLRHPNIIDVHDIGNEDGQLFFTMDLLEGRSLQEFGKKKPGIRRIVDILIKVGEALHYAHEQGVVHRDIKPANIMLDSKNEPKVMDFGLAKLKRSNQKLSQSGVILGTLYYMPPEQAEGNIRAIDERSDVYALGAVLYELLTGRPPFVSTSFSQLVDQILHRDPVPPTDLKARIPKDLESICLKAIEKKRKKRYQSAAEFVTDLERFRQHEAVQAHPLGHWGRLLRKLRRHKAIVIFVGFLFISLVTWIGGSGIWRALEHAEQLKSLLQKSRRSREHVMSAQEITRKYDLENILDRSLPADARHEIERALHRHMSARVFLEQALALAPQDPRIRQALYQVEREIGLLALLGRNYILSPFFFERCKRLGDPAEAERLLRLVRQQKERIKQRQLQRIREIMAELDKTLPQEGMVEQYVTELVRMQSAPAVRELLTYIRSRNEWQRRVAIEALGKLGDRHTTFQGKNVVDRLLERLQQLADDVETHLAEAEELIWALGRLKAARANTLIHKIRCRVGKESLFWEKTRLPYRWIPLPNETTQKALTAQEINVRGELKCLKGDYEAAIMDFTRAIRLNPEFAEAYNNRGKAMCLREKLDQLTNDERITDLKVLAFSNADQKRNVLSAIQADFTRAIELKPDLADAYINRAIVRQMQGDLKGTLADYDQAVKLDPQNPKIYLNRGILRYMNRSLEAACADCTKVIELQPGAWSAYNIRGLVYYARNQYAKAQKDYSQAIMLNPRDSMLYNNRGIVYVEQRQLGQALEDFNRAIRVNPQNVLAYGNRALIYAKFRQYDKSLEDYTQAIKLAPNDAKLYYSRGIVYRKLNRPAAAKADFVRAIRYQPAYRERVQRLYRSGG